MRRPHARRFAFLADQARFNGMGPRPGTIFQQGVECKHIFNSTITYNSEIITVLFRIASTGNPCQSIPGEVHCQREQYHRRRTTDHVLVFTSISVKALARTHMCIVHIMQYYHKTCLENIVTLIHCVSATTLPGGHTIPSDASRAHESTSCAGRSGVSLTRQTTTNNYKDNFHTIQSRTISRIQMIGILYIRWGKLISCWGTKAVRISRISTQSCSYHHRFALSTHVTTLRIRRFHSSIWRRRSDEAFRKDPVSNRYVR